MDWLRILAYVTGTVDQELLARNEYLASENRILLAERPTDVLARRASHARRDWSSLGRKVLAEVATVGRPDTILPWYRKLADAQNFSLPVTHGLRHNPPVQLRSMSCA